MNGSPGEDAAAREGALEGERVGVIKSASGRESVGDAGHGDACWREHLFEVGGGCLAFNIRAESKDDFPWTLLAGATDEGIDGEILGADLVERGQLSPKHMIAAGKGTRAFDGKNIGRLLDNTEFAPGAFGVQANDTAGVGRKESAAFARAKREARGLKGGRQLFRPGIPG